MKLQNKEGNKKNMKRRMRAFICVIIMLMSSVLYNYNGNIQASTEYKLHYEGQVWFYEAYR